MKKSILAIAVAATMAAPAAVMAAPTVYGNVHLSLNAADNDIEGADNNLTISSNTSAIGVKGSEDLGDGLKAIYKLEFQVGIAPGATIDPDGDFNNGSSLGSLSGRDQFFGLKAGWGALKFGTMSSNYKQMGGKVDPLYRTPLEGRGFLNMQSAQLHGGKGINRGRETNTVQYVSPKMAGIQLVANTTFSGSNDETSGIGLRWSNKAFLVYADWIDGQSGSFSTVTTTVTGNLISDSFSSGAVQDCKNSSTANVNGTTTDIECATESAWKVGGKFSAKAFSLALQYESAQDRTGFDYIFAAGTWNINKNNALTLTVGQADFDEPEGVTQSLDTQSYALAYNHNLSKMTNVYVGYGAKSNDFNIADSTIGDLGSELAGDESMFTAGMRVKF